MSLLEDGHIIRGTYEVERMLGEGAFAEVYRVKHRFLGRQAMKVFKLMGMDLPAIERMLSEAVMLSRIGHPNIVRVFDANTIDTDDGILGFFTMEYVAGGSLDQFWRSHGLKLVPVETSVDILRQVCRGLAVAHGETPPIVHRDIKMQNILAGYDGAGLRVRVSDFGLAKHVNPLTLLASAKGTRAFKAPEVFRDALGDSCAGDVWALGATFYLLLTDQLPYPDLAEFDLMGSTRFQRPVVPPGQINVHVDPALEAIALRALALNPSERYATAQAMLADLEKWRPRPAGKRRRSKSDDLGESAKSTLGVFSPANQETARTMAANALRLARQAEKLIEAADLMEEAFNKWPELREEHAYHVELWRRGIMM